MQEKKRENYLTLLTLVLAFVLVIGVRYDNVVVAMSATLHVIIGLGTFTTLCYALAWRGVVRVSKMYHLIKHTSGECEAEMFLARHAKLCKSWSRVMESYRNGEHMHPALDLLYYLAMMSAGIKTNSVTLVVMLAIMCVLDLSFRAEADEPTAIVSVHVVG